MCEKLGVNAWEVIEAASTKPFGFMKFTPGPGLGGHCIPIDPFYLSWKLKTLDYDARFIKLAGEINTQMPDHIVRLISENLNKNQQAINSSKLLIMGISYKKDINDIRESPALDIIQLLHKAGANVDYHDPFVPELKLDNFTYKSVKIDKEEFLKGFDATIIITDHSNVEYEKIYNSSKLIIDTRNVFYDKNGEHLVRLGEG
jgi:UDP-N-acetyl-D-glucosamine dehydrogenase